MLSQNDDGRLKIPSERAFFTSYKKHDLDEKKPHIALHDILNTIPPFCLWNLGEFKDVLNNRGCIICQLNNMSEEKKQKIQVACFLGQTVIGMFWSGCTEEEEEWALDEGA